MPLVTSGENYRDFSEPRFFECPTVSDIAKIRYPVDKAHAFVASTSGGGLEVWKFDANADPLESADGFNIIDPNNTAVAGHWRRTGGTVNALLFATGDGTTDDSTALQSMVDLVPTGAAIIFPGGYTFAIGTAIEVDRPLHFQGPGTILMTGNNNGFNLAAGALETFAGGSFDGLHFESDSVGTSITNAIIGSVNTLSGISIRNCTFGRVGISLSDATCNTTASNTDLSIVDNYFDGDYTGTIAGDVSNIIDIRGFREVLIEGNKFNTAAHERFIKLSCSCRSFVISGNTFRSTSATIGKQAIDMFSDARRGVITDNVFILNGSWSSGVHIKGDSVATGGSYSEPAELVIKNNVFEITTTAASAQPIFMLGSWGLSAATLLTNAVQIADNQIKMTATSSTESSIVARGWTQAIISNNQLYRTDNTAYVTAIDCSNCRDISIKGNQINYGKIQVLGSSSTPDGQTYTGQPTHVLVQGNTIDNWRELAALYVASCTALDSLVVSGNSFNNTATSNALGIIAFETNTITEVVIDSNSGVVDNATKVAYSATTPTRCMVRSNAWQVLSAAPATGTWVRGDVIENSAPSSAGPPGWVCTTGGTPGTWSARANLA